MYLKQVNLLHPLIIVIFAYTPAVSPDKLTFFLIFSLSLTFSTGLVYFFQNIWRKGVRICDFHPLIRRMFPLSQHLKKTGDFL